MLPQIDLVLPHWLYWGGLALFPLVFMAVRRGRDLAREARAPAAAAPAADEIVLVPAGSPELTPPGNRFTRAVDRLSGFTGVFVAYWTVIAVFVYFYEVVARYLFNSPTNWAHESMFLMFGMQYVLAGAYAYLHDAHVRVDLLYAKAGPRRRAALDIVSGLFFLIFILAFIGTSWTFFSSAMNRDQFFFAAGYFNEVSFSEWAVAYYPVKLTLVLGGVLLLLQGVSRLVKDVQTFRMLDYEAHG